MSYTDDSAGPSHPKKMKVQNNKTLMDEEMTNLLAELSDEYPSDFSYNSDDEFSNDDDEEEEIVQEAACQQDDSAMVEKVIWENDSTSMKKFPFIKSECLLQPISGNNPIHFFRHFFTDDILEEIVAETNDYAQNLLLHRKRKEHSRINVWKDTTKEELLVFVGLILHMGTIRMNRIEDYWKTDPLFGLLAFSENMSRNRFFLLLKALHFAKIPDQNIVPPEEEIINMVNLFNARVSEIYYPGREFSIDESMVLWHERLTFRQYIPNKHHNHGIKLHMITTPPGMVLKFLVSTGVLDYSGGPGHIQNIVMNLLEGMLDVGHSVFMDNYYNSYDLAKCLADRKTHCTGTIRKNRKTFPNEVNEKKLKKGQTVAKYANGVMIAKWQDKRDVTYISNEYKNDMVKKTNKRGEIISKPLPVIQYNKFMAGIDKRDHMLAYCPCERKTIRWPTKIFVYILQIMMNNSHLIYNKYSNENLSLYDFRLSVIRSLVKQPSVLRAPVCEQSEHVLIKREEKKAGKIVRKRCKSCGSQGKRKDTIYICNVCEGSPGYCLDCAKVTHK